LKLSEEIANGLLEWETYGHYQFLSEKNKTLVKEVEVLEAVKPIIVALVEAKLDYDAVMKLDSIDANRELIAFARKALPLLDSNILEKAFGDKSSRGSQKSLEVK
jgi:hypothetical protein